MDQQGDNHTIYVSNLPYSLKEEDLETLFKDAGKTIKIRVMRDRQTRRSRGFAFVAFGSREEMNKAIEMNGMEVGGRKLKIELSVSETSSGDKRGTE